MKNLITLSLQEDLPQGDITTQAIFAASAQTATAQFLAKEALVISGWSVVQELLQTQFKKLKLKVLYKDGTLVKNKTIIGTVTGPIQQLLVFERLALNFLQHLSGIATHTHAFVQKTKATDAKILDTRKTLPGLRALEKLAVKHGGGYNHRMNLSDQYLIKDNHIDAAGGIKEALQLVFRHQKQTKKKPKIEIEVRNLVELSQALMYQIDIVLLDNMTPKMVKQAVVLRDALAPKTLLEVSGGITLKTVARYAKLGVDRISVGAITHSSPAVDISLKIRS